MSINQVFFLQIHDTFSSANDSKGSSLAWDNSADLLDNAHILPTDLSAQIVDHMNNDDIMDNNQGFHITQSKQQI